MRNDFYFRYAYSIKEIVDFHMENNQKSYRGLGKLIGRSFTSFGRLLTTNLHHSPNSLKTRLDNPPVPRKCTLAWAALIRLVYEVDPLKCPKCGSQMEIVSFIEDDEVIEKMLRHAGLWPAPAIAGCGEDGRDSAKPPPPATLAA
jgi:hypothetical protein